MKSQTPPQKAVFTPCPKYGKQGLRVRSPNFYFRLPSFKAAEFMLPYRSCETGANNRSLFNPLPQAGLLDFHSNEAQTLPPHHHCGLHPLSDIESLGCGACSCSSEPIITYYSTHFLKHDCRTFTPVRLNAIYGFHLWPPTSRLLTNTHSEWVSAAKQSGQYHIGI